MANVEEITVRVLTVTEDELRRIIREEVAKARQPVAYPPNTYPVVRPYNPYQEPRQWWQNPVIC